MCSHVYSKDFFKDVMRRVAPSSPFFIARKKRYVFESPAALRRVAKAQQLRTAPFVTLWHCFVGAAREKCIKACQKAFAGSSTVVAASSKHLPAELKSSNDQVRRNRRARVECGALSRSRCRHANASEKSSAIATKNGALNRTARMRAGGRFISMQHRHCSCDFRLDGGSFAINPSEAMMN